MDLLVRPAPEEGYQGNPINTVPQVVLYDHSDPLARRVISDFIQQFRPGRALAPIRERFALFEVGEDVRHISHTSTSESSDMTLNGELLRLSALAPRGAAERRDFGLGIGIGFTLVHLIAFVNSDRDQETRRDFVVRCSRQLTAFENAVVVLWLVTAYPQIRYGKLRQLAAGAENISRIVLLPARLEGVRQTEAQQVEMTSAILADLAGADLGTSPAWLLTDLFAPPARLHRRLEVAKPGEIMRNPEPRRPLLVVGAHTVASGRSEADQFLAHRLASSALHELLLRPDAPIDLDRCTAMSEAMLKLLTLKRTTFVSAASLQVAEAGKEMCGAFDPAPLLEMDLADRAAVVRHNIRKVRTPVTGSLPRFLADTQDKLSAPQLVGSSEILAMADKEIGWWPGGIRTAIQALRMTIAKLTQEPLPERPAPDFLPEEQEADPSVGLIPAFAPTLPLVVWALVMALFFARTLGVAAALVPLAGFTLWEATRYWRGGRSERAAVQRPLRTVRAYLDAYRNWLLTVWFPRRQLLALRDTLTTLERTMERWRYRQAEHDREAGVAVRPLTSATWTSYLYTGKACRDEAEYLCRSMHGDVVSRDWARRLQQIGQRARSAETDMTYAQFGAALREASAADLERLALDWAGGQLSSNWGPAPLSDGDPGPFLAGLERFCMPPGTRTARLLFCQNIGSPVAAEAAARHYRVVDQIDSERISVWLLSEWSDDQGEEA